MKVKYQGRLGVLTAEYNGVRYAIPRGETKDIPIEVYDYIKRSGHVHAQELRPDIDSYENEIKLLKEKISLLEAKPKETPKDARKTSKKK